jgi:hypothetical protein
MRSITWFGLVTIATLGGCTVTTQPAQPVAYSEPTAYVETTAAPVDYENYPHTVYEGRTVYYVGDRWQYREGSRWLSYRTEPVFLRQHRATLQQQPRRVEEPRRAPAAPAARPEERHEERHDERR